jgi:hypothetical protein
MPLYIFTNETETEYVDVFFHMNDEKKFVGPDKKEWRRVYTVPTASVDNRIDPFSKQDFVEKTGRKKGTYGNLLDAAKEASILRTEKAGKDFVKEKWLGDYKKTNNVDYFDSSKDKVIKKNGVTIDFGSK